MDLHDVARPDPIRRPRLIAEDPRRIRVLAQIQAQDLHRHLTLDVDVLGLVHHAHAALTQPLEQAIARPRDLPGPAISRTRPRVRVLAR
jgi:hypothetical protein